MNISNRYLASASTKCVLLALTSALITPAYANGVSIDKVRVGRDNNSVNNEFIQPRQDSLSGGGRDQTMQFGDTVSGTKRDDLLIGRLGDDVMFGGPGNDVILGGLEHFNPLNRDRAFGGSGNDIFIWKPGDGSDLFEGGPGYDVVVFGLVGEIDDNGQLDFSVSQDQQAGAVGVNRRTLLPFVDVTNSPGFCDVIDESTSPDAKQLLRSLGLHDLVRFSLRGVADSFASGEQIDDNGLRVTLHLRSVEALICTNREGGQIEILDLTVSPPQPITLDSPMLRRLRNRLANIIR